VLNIALTLTHLWVVPDVNRTVGADWVSWNWPSFRTTQLFCLPAFIYMCNTQELVKIWKKVEKSSPTEKPTVRRFSVSL